MTETISQPDRLDYVVLFESEPVWEHPDGWFNGLRFQLTRANDHIEVELAVDEDWFSMVWQQDGQPRLRLQCVMATGWRIVRSPTSECLHFAVIEDEIAKRSFTLQLQPRIALFAEERW